MKRSHLWTSIGMSVTFLAVMSTQVFAGPGGSGVGNAGGVIVLPGGKVVLADPYIQRADGIGQRYDDFNPQIKSQLELVGRLMVRLGAEVDQSLLDESNFPPGTPHHVIVDQSKLLIAQRELSRTSQAQFLVDRVMSKLIEYHFVDRLPSDCVGSEDVVNVPKGGVNVMEACTVGPLTYIQRDLFKQMDMNEQMRLVLHERLHSLNQVLHEEIIDITNGMGLILKLYQAQQAGDRTPLTQDQVDAISRVVLRIGQLRDLDDTKAMDGEYMTNWKVMPNGGGLAHKNAVVSPTSFIGVGSILSEDSVLKDKAEMMDSACFSAVCTIGTGTVVNESVLGALDEDSEDLLVGIDDGAKILSSQLTLRTQESEVNAISIAPGSTISGSLIQGVHSVHTNSGSNITSTRLTIGGQSSVNLTVGAQAQVTGLVANVLTPAAINSTPATVEISVPASQSLTFTAPLMCYPGTIPLMLGDLKLDSVAALSNVCIKPIPKK
jgi:hypothetical protein